MLTVHPSLNSFTGARVLISGSGNVAQYAALKVISLGAVVLSLSDSHGTLIAKSEKGFTPAHIASIASLKLNRQALTAFDYEEGAFEWHEGKRPWTLVKADIALPSATQNEVSGEEAQALVDAGVKIIAEGSNMGCTLEAIAVFEKSRTAGGPNAAWYAPGSASISFFSSLLLNLIFCRVRAEASNCGGVAVSGLEMAQNSARLTWAPADVDAKLNSIMENAYNACFETGKQYGGSGQEGVLPSLVVGANISGFIKVCIFALFTQFVLVLTLVHRSRMLCVLRVTGGRHTLIL